MISRIHIENSRAGHTRSNIFSDIDCEIYPYTWPLLSHDLKNLNFYLCGYIGVTVYVPLFLTSLAERIRAAASTNTPVLLADMWTELDCVYICTGLLTVPSVKAIHC